MPEVIDWSLFFEAEKMQEGLGNRWTQFFLWFTLHGLYRIWFL